MIKAWKEKNCSCLHPDVVLLPGCGVIKGGDQKGWDGRGFPNEGGKYVISINLGSSHGNLKDNNIETT